MLSAVTLPSPMWTTSVLGTGSAAPGERNSRPRTSVTEFGDTWTASVPTVVLPYFKSPAGEVSLTSSMVAVLLLLALQRSQGQRLVLIVFALAPYARAVIVGQRWVLTGRLFVHRGAVRVR